MMMTMKSPVAVFNVGVNISDFHFFLSDFTKHGFTQLNVICICGVIQSNKSLNERYNLLQQQHRTRKCIGSDDREKFGFT